jgi:uncharacterized protein YuzE
MVYCLRSRPPYFCMKIWSTSEKCTVGSMGTGFEQLDVPQQGNNKTILGGTKMTEMDRFNGYVFVVEDENGTVIAVELDFETAINAAKHLPDVVHFLDIWKDGKNIHSHKI